MASEQTVTTVSQLPNIVNLRRKRGDTFPFSMTFTNSETGVPVDLTGSTVVLTLSPTSDPLTDSEEIFQLTGVLSGTPTDGVATFTMTALEADQEPNTYFYDVQRTLALDIRTICEGSFEFVQDINKD